MTIYLDVVFLINFSYDLILLLSVNIILNRNAPFKRIFFGALFGGLSILFLFLKLSHFYLFIIKSLISILLSIITFKHKNLKYTINNLIYLYITTILLGGFIYLLNHELSYKNNGLSFYYKGLSINIIILLILSPLILRLYIKKIKELKNSYNNYYQVVILFNDQELNLIGYLDSGNKLYDPYFHYPIILVSKNELSSITIRSPIYVPFKSLNNEGIITCFKPNKLFINETLIKKVLIGISEHNFNIDNVSCLLNPAVMKGINNV